MLDVVAIENLLEALGHTEDEINIVIEYSKTMLNGLIGKDCFNSNTFEKRFIPSTQEQRINSFYLPIIENLGAGYRILGNRIFYNAVGHETTVRFTYGINEQAEKELLTLNPTIGS